MTNLFVRPIEFSLFQSFLLLILKRLLLLQFLLGFTARHLLFQTAWGVARQGLELARTGGLVTASALAPAYHRLSQAERERLSRLEQETNIH